MILSIGAPVDSTLAAARTALPDDDRLLTLEYAIDSFDSDPAVAQRAQQAIAREFQRNAALGPAAEERYREMTGTIYRFTGHSFYIRRQWRQATDSYEIAAKLSSSSFAGWRLSIRTTRRHNRISLCWQSLSPSKKPP